jgi:hypothetical protein
VTNDSSLGAHNDLSTFCGVPTGAEVFYKFTLTAREMVYVDTFGSSFDTVVGIFSDCNGTVAAGGTACNDDSACANDYLRSHLVTTLDPGTYYIALDSYNYGTGTNSMGGPFTMNFQHSGTGCAAAVPIADSSTVTGTTCASGSSQVLGSCGGYGDEQVYYFLECPGSHTFNASTCSASTPTDTVLYVKAGNCLDSTTVACDDDYTCAANTTNPFTSTLSNVTLPGGGIYYLVVDTFSTACGGYSLSTTYLP